MATVLKEEIKQVFCVHGLDTEGQWGDWYPDQLEKDKLCSLYLAYLFTSFPFLEFSYASASGQNRLAVLMKRSHPWTPPCPSSWTEPWPPRRGSGQGCSCWEQLQLLCEHILWLMWHILISNIYSPFFSPFAPPASLFLYAIASTEKCDEALASPLPHTAFTSSSVFSNGYAPGYAKLNRRGGEFADCVSIPPKLNFGSELWVD